MQVRDRDRVGQLIVPIPRDALSMTGPEIVSTYLPLALATAKEHDATLAGTPELLTETEARDRVTGTPELVAGIDAARPNSLFLLATIIPHDWSDFDAGRFRTTEHVARPVRRRPRRN